MRIAIVGPTHPYKGGVAQHTTQLAHRLAALGHDVSLESWLRQYPERLYPGQQRVETPEMPVFPGTTYPLSWNRPDGWWRLGRRLRKTQDVVILVLVSPVQAPALAVIAKALKGGPRLIALCHNVLPHERRSIDERLVRAVLKQADAVMVHSVKEEQLARTLTSADTAVSPLPPPHRFAVEGATPPDPDRPVSNQLLFFGLVRPYKGLDVLIRALALTSDVSLVVAGEFWGGVAPTQELVDQLGLKDRVDLRPGYVDAADVPALIRSADVMVLPYRDSTASWNGSLALEHGVPVIATRVGTMAEQVRDGVDGLLCEPEDVEGLAEAIKRVYEPGVLQELRRGIGPAAGEEAWDAYVEAITGLASR
jgi:glycosyltransferase involved in cell wall biosynthesis